MAHRFGLAGAVWLVCMLLTGGVNGQAILNPPPVYTSPTYVEVPVAQQEVIKESPGPSYVWVPGQWDRTADSWNWKAGEWVEPPFSNAYYVPGYWQHQGGQFQWETGHWAAAQRGVVAQKPIAVPAAYEEVQPAAPAATGFAWQPGYWTWCGTWVWVPGAYVQTATPNAVWVEGQWQVGVNGQWNWIPAHWSAA